MKAAYYTDYGNADKLQIGHQPLPEPNDNEIRIKIMTSSVNPIDWKVRKGMLKWFIKKPFPIITGADFCGVVDKPAKIDPHLQKGDIVLGQKPGLKGGASAEYCVVTENDVILKPENISNEEASGLSLAGQTSYQALIESAELKKGQSLLIIGASGGIGQMAIQIAKAHGATVTAVCSQKNHELVLDLGADNAIDYHTTDIRQSNQQFDVIYDCVGQDTLKTCQSILKKKAVFLTPAPALKTIFPLLRGKLINKLFKTPKVFIVMLKPSQQKLKALTELIKNHQLKIIVDKVFSLDEIQQAHEYSESQRARGKIIVKI